GRKRDCRRGYIRAPSGSHCRRRADRSTTSAAAAKWRASPRRPSPGLAPRASRSSWNYPYVSFETIACCAREGSDNALGRKQETSMGEAYIVAAARTAGGKKGG